MGSQILADKANVGYDSGWGGSPIVRFVNGESIRSLEHLVSVIRAARRQDSRDNFLIFDVSMSSGPFRLVLPVEELDNADKRVCNIYGVPTSCCSDHYLEK